MNAPRGPAALPAIPVLDTPRLRLRAPAAADFEAEAALLADPARTRFLGGPQDREQAWRSFAAGLGHWLLRGFGRWAVEETATGAYCGLVGPWFPEGWPEPEIGWTLTAAAEGRGLAFEAAQAARAHAYDALGWTTAISLIDPGNTRSVTLAERLGAHWEGEFNHVRFGRMGIWRHPAPEATR